MVIDIIFVIKTEDVLRRQKTYTCLNNRRPTKKISNDLIGGNKDEIYYWFDNVA